MKILQRHIILALFLLSTATSYAQLAFPEAMGYGKDATGGRTGEVYHVTTLDDDGDGSFRDAVSSSNRIVVFDVSGYIQLESAVTVASNITIAGQTAPGEGIGIRSGKVSCGKSSNIIIRYMRFRPGSETASNKDVGLNLYNAHNIIIDHCSIEFAPWNNIGGVTDDYTNYPVTDITFQYCLIADPTYQQFGAHCESIDGYWSWYYNAFANSHNRNPLDKVHDVFVNNILYNCSAGYTTHTSYNFYHDIIANYFIMGPASTGTDNQWYQVDKNQSIYYDANMKDSDLDGELNGSSTTPYWYQGEGEILDEPWSETTDDHPIYSAETAFRLVTSRSGVLPYDDMDELVWSQINTLGSGTTGLTAGTRGPDGGLYDSQEETGLDNDGYGYIESGTLDDDTDGDGMPDYWEAALGTDASGDDAMTLDDEGYAYIENYINWLGAKHATADENYYADIDLREFTSGFQDVSPTYTFVSSENCSVTILSDGYTAEVTPDAYFTGIATFDFTVSGTDGSEYTGTVWVLVVPSDITLEPETYIYENDGTEEDTWENTVNWTPEGTPSIIDTAIIRTGDAKVSTNIKTPLVRIEPNGTLRMMGNYEVPNIELQGGTLKVYTSNSTYGLTSDIELQEASTIWAGSQDTSVFWLEGSLSGSADLTKTYTGILDLNVDASEYTGSWDIAEGTFRIANSTSISQNFVTVESAASMNIAAEDVFILSVDLGTSTINLQYDLTVREFIIDDTSLDPGNYTASDYPDAILGTGTLTVIGITDCAGVDYGDAYYDDCDECVGGTTGATACVQDCNGDWGGDAYYDDCELCVGGNTDAVACNSKGEAEDACSYDGTIDTNHVDYTGEGFVNIENASGSAMTLNLYAYTAGTYTFEIMYSNGGSAARPMTFSANGTELTLNFDPTDDWDTWIAEEVTITLAEGANECTLTSTGDDGGPNIDKFVFYTDDLAFGSCETDCNGVFGGAAYYDDCGTCVGGDTGEEACDMTKLQAEEACSYDGTVDSDNDGFEGTGFVNTPNETDQSIAFKVVATTAQTVTLYIQYANGDTLDRAGKLLINDEEAVSTVSMPSTNEDWTDYQAVSYDITLQSGINEIELISTTTKGFGSIDFFGIVGDAAFADCDDTIQSIDLKEGWNLVSLYITPDNSLTGSVFPNATIIKTLDEFYYSSQDEFLNTLTDIVPGNGYLVYNTIAETITISGVETQCIASLQDGLNLIGTCNSESTTIEDAFGTDAESIILIKNFDGFWEYEGETNSIENLEPGEAYFLWK